MRILITGANGFFGRYLTRVCSGFDTMTIGLTSSDINTDIGHIIPPITGHFHLVIHAAGKAHTIPHNSDEEDEFFRVNFKGTVNLIKALNHSNSIPEKFVFISSVAVYGKEKGELISEASYPEGKTPYAKSKIQAENYLLNWANDNNVKLIILRLPLLVGDNPPGNLGAMISAIRAGHYYSIGDGSTCRSAVLAEDVAKLIVNKDLVPGIYNLTDGYHPSYREIENAIANLYGKKIKSIPFILAKILSRLGDVIPGFPINSGKLDKLTSTLTFSDEKARNKLGWSSRPIIEFFSDQIL